MLVKGVAEVAEAQDHPVVVHDAVLRPFAGLAETFHVGVDSFYILDIRLDAETETETQNLLVDPLARHLVQQGAVLDHLLEERDDLLAGVALDGFFQHQGRILGPFFQQVVLHGGFIAQIEFLPAALDLVERRLGDVEVAPLDELRHLAEEEGEQQGEDMGAVHVGIGHDDDPVVAELGNIEVVLADAGPHGGDQGADLLGGEHLVEAGLFHVEDLPLEGQDRLEFPVTPLLCAASGRIALHQIEFAERRVLFLAVGQLAGEVGDVQRPLAPGQLPRLAGRFPSPCGLDGFADDLPGDLGILLQEDRQLFVHHRFHKPLDLRIPQLGLGLPLELGLGDLDRDDRGQPFTQVFAGDGHLFLLQQLVGRGVAVHGPGERRPEADQVGAPLMGVDVVGKGKELFVIGIIVLHGNFYIDTAFFTVEEDRFGMQGVLVPVQILDEGNDAAFIVEIVMLILFPFIVNGDPDAGIEEGEFAQPLGKDVEGKIDGLENGVVGEEGNLGAPFLRLTDRLQGSGGITVGVGLPPEFAVAADLQVQLLRQGIDHRDADAVETAGHLV